MVIFAPMSTYTQPNRSAAENHGAKLEIGRSPLGGAEFRLVFSREQKEF